MAKKSKPEEADEEARAPREERNPRRLRKQALESLRPVIRKKPRIDRFKIEVPDFTEDLLP
jgi:hypothetical protein